MILPQSWLYLMFAGVLVCGSFCAAVQPTAENYPGEGKETEAEKFFRETESLLKLIRQESPRAAEILCRDLKKKRTKILKDFLEKSGVGIRVVEKPLPPPSAVRPPFYSEKLCGGKIFYMRPSGLFPGTLDQCLRRAPIIAASQGVVLDLRQCKGYSHSHLPMLVKLFTKTKNKAGQTVPAAVITGPGTEGTAELLAGLLAQKGVMTIGEPTAGMPFLLRRVSSGPEGKGPYVYVPLIPEQWKELPPGAFTPVIRRKSSPGYDRKKVSLLMDHSLRTATDLLLSIHAMNLNGTK